MVQKNCFYYKVSVGISLIGIAALLTMAVRYVFWIGFADHGEVAMTAISWMLFEGKPIYTSLLAAERYSIQHGPAVYFFMGFFMKVFGASIFTAKLAGLVVVLVNLILSWLCFRNFLTARVTLLLIGVECWVLLKWPFVFFSRDDSLMMMCVIAALWCCQSNRRTLSMIGFSVALGSMASLKIHGVIYLLPIVVMWYQQYGLKKTVGVLGFAVLIALLPFCLPGISLVHYSQWLLLSGRHGFEGRLFVGNVTYLFLMLLIPILSGCFYRIDWNKVWKKEYRVMVATFFSGLIVAVIGSKAGSGNYHLIPFVPLICYFAARLYCYRNDLSAGHYTIPVQSKRPVLFVAAVLIGVVLIVSAVNSQKRLFSTMNKYSFGEQVVAEIYEISRIYQDDTLAIGYGDDSSYNLYRQFIPIAIFAGNPYLFDGAAMMDMQLSGLPTPSSTLEALENGLIHVWLIPAGTSPWTIHSYYDTLRPVFDEQIKTSFYRNYVLIKKMQYFDIWQYQRRPAIKVE